MSRNVNQDTKVVSESPLVQLDFLRLKIPSDELRLVEDPFLTHINLRGNASSVTFVLAVQSVLDIILPTLPNTALMTAKLTVLWCGPDEWLIMAATDRAEALVSDLKAALKDEHSQVTDISGGNTVIDISGSSARALMRKASTIDFHPREFAVGKCALTTFAHANAAIYQYDDTPGYRIVVRRSFADYIGVWLMDAAREYQAAPSDKLT